MEADDHVLLKREFSPGPALCLRRRSDVRPMAIGHAFGARRASAQRSV